MSHIIDIRKEEVAKTEVIVFADASVGFNNAQSLEWNEDPTVINMISACGGTIIEINMEDIDNLIKALKGAKEAWQK